MRGDVFLRLRGPWRRMAALVLLLALVPACQVAPAQIFIPAAYALTGMCVALLVSPTFTAAIVGLVVGALLGAAVYNNSLKRALLERQQSGAPPVN